MKIASFLAASACAIGLAVVAPAAAQTQASHWYRGNTHTHTLNSRGGDTAPHEVALWYREHGYQFLFITDHDEYLTDVAPLNALVGRDQWFLILPGQENGQRIKRKEGKNGDGHVNGLFTREVIHSPREGTTLEGAIGQVLAQGALAQVNHPNYAWSLKPGDFDNVPDGTLLEIWNGLDGINNLGGDDGKGDVRPTSEGYWDYLLSRGKIIWATAADDAHIFKGEHATPGRAWISVRAPELTPAAIKTALTNGSFYASTGVTLADISADTTSLNVTITAPGTNASNQPRYLTRFIGQGGKVLAEVAGLQPSYRFVGGETYVRASIIDSNDQRAWTQPVFLDGRLARRR